MEEKEPRAVSAEELTTRVLTHVRHLVDFWDNAEQDSTRDKLSGLAFSILTMLDGASVDLPAFDVLARPHPDDKAFHIAEGENYIEDGTALEPWLHEKWYA